MQLTRTLLWYSRAVVHSGLLHVDWCFARLDGLIGNAMVDGSTCASCWATLHCIALDLQCMESLRQVPVWGVRIYLWVTEMSPSLQ